VSDWLSALTASFERAARAGGGALDLAFDIAGRSLRVRLAGPALRATPVGRRLAVLVTSVVAFPFLLHALPRVVWVQHWVVGTPLLALAAVLATDRPAPGSRAPRGIAAFDDRSRWREEPLEKELASLAAVEVRKFRSVLPPRTGS
jgi:hypothetical protein